MAGGRKRTELADLEPDRSDEAWIRLANTDQAVRIRHLSTILANGAVLTDVRFIEGQDELWSLWLRLSDRPGEFRLNMYRSDEPKIFRDLGLAVAMVRADFEYGGTITLSTERRLDKTAGGDPAGD